MGFGMMKELLNGGVWNKTSQLIQDKYGKKIEFRFLTVIESEQPFYSNGDDLVVPLKSRHKYLGDVVIQRAAMMTIDEKMELTDLIQFLIEPQAYNLHLKSVENSLASKPQTEHVVDTNVISIFGKFDSRENALDFNEESEKRKTISNILHLKSKNTLLRQKVASQLHEISGSPFFIRMQDISKSIHSVSDLKDLAGSTIFIENILQLTSSEIEIVADFAKDHQGIELQFLIGSDLSDKEIASLPCHEQLKKDLLGFLFEIDKVPASQQTQKEVLELLFFSFDQSIS
jgi:hypothetical protein